MLDFFFYVMNFRVFWMENYIVYEIKKTDREKLGKRRMLIIQFNFVNFSTKCISNCFVLFFEFVPLHFGAFRSFKNKEKMFLFWVHCIYYNMNKILFLIWHCIRNYMSLNMLRIFRAMELAYWDIRRSEG